MAFRTPVALWSVRGGISALHYVVNYVFEGAVRETPGKEREGVADGR